MPPFAQSIRNLCEDRDRSLEALFKNRLALIHDRILFDRALADPDFDDDFTAPACPNRCELAD